MEADQSAPEAESAQAGEITTEAASADNKDTTDGQDKVPYRIPKKATAEGDAQKDSDVRGGSRSWDRRSSRKKRSRSRRRSRSRSRGRKRDRSRSRDRNRRRSSGGGDRDRDRGRDRDRVRVVAEERGR